MAKTIWKYPLEAGVINDVQLPGGAQILSIAEQFGALHMWVEVDRTNSPSWHKVAVIGTGWANPEIPGFVRKFVGTALLAGGSLVWHVFHFVPEEATN